MKNQKGFTLIEMVVVMAILAILSSALYPRISAYIAMNKERYRVSQEHLVNKALIQYYALTGNYYRPAFACDVGDTLSDANAVIMIDELNDKTGSMIPNNSGEYIYLKVEGSDTLGFVDIRMISVSNP